MVSCCSNYMLYKLLCTYGLNKCAFEAELPICVCLGIFCSMDGPLFIECFCFVFFCKTCSMDHQLSLIATMILSHTHWLQPQRIL